MKRHLAVFLALAVAWIFAPRAGAVTVSLSPARDTTIFLNNPANAGGAANGLLAGTNATGAARRALIAFDVAGAIPAGSIIQSAELRMTLAQTAGGGGGGGSQSIELHRLLADWGEGNAQEQTPPTDSLSGQGQGDVAFAGDATWNSNFHGASLWAMPGGDFQAAASAALAVGGSVGSQFTWGSSPTLVSEVQGWLDGPASNFGWLIKNASESTSSNIRGFYSSEVATAALHPTLVVTYAVPEPTGALFALGMALGLPRVRWPVGRRGRRSAI